MSLALIELLGSGILGSIECGEEVRLPAPSAIAKLQAWSKRYDEASLYDREAELSAIGREMFAWLDESGWASAWTLGSGDRNLEIRVKGAGGTEEEALLDAPWELLSRADGPPLAFDDIQLFIVARRIGPKTAPLEPRHGDLQLMFMAAAPEGQQELDYEAEETAILEATRLLPMRVVVEETGALEFLGARLTSDEGPFEALHLSCHGDIDREKGPILLLENAEGGSDRVGPGAIVGVLGAEPPPLVLLSACRTAELGSSPGAAFIGHKEGIGSDRLRDSGQPTAKTGPELATPFVRRLAAKIANVVGWDGSVYDADATAFATHFYQQLAARSPVPRAAAVARQALFGLKASNPSQGRHWHLARVYIGPKGGGPLCAQGKPKRRSAADGAQAVSRQGEAARAGCEPGGVRRSASRNSTVLRSFRDAQSGVLIHGMGALGKSSLAARVQSRMPHHHPVVIFERYDALTIFDQVLQALEFKTQAVEKAQWRDIVKADTTQLAQALQSWLSDPLDAKPILLIIDDLERILETPTQSDAPTGVAAAYRDALAAVLLAFDRAPTQSLLLLTSRYNFRLPGGTGGDLAQGLARVPLKPMATRERQKQWRAAERVAGRAIAELGEAAKSLLSRALDAAAGNPGLQAILTRPILAGEFAAAEEALRQIGVYRDTGAPPAEIEALIAAGTAKDSDNALTAFFARVSFKTYGDALTPDQRRQLGARDFVLARGSDSGPRARRRRRGERRGCAGQGDRAPARPRPARRLGRDRRHSPRRREPARAPARAEDRRGRSPASRPRGDAGIGEGVAPAARDFSLDPRGLEVALIAIVAGAEPPILEVATLAGAVWLELAENRTREALDLIAKSFCRLSPRLAFSRDFCARVVNVLTFSAIRRCSTPSSRRRCERQSPDIRTPEFRTRFWSYDGRSTCRNPAKSRQPRPWSAKRWRPSRRLPTISARRSLPANSPTSTRRVANSTELCGYGGKNNYRFSSASARYTSTRRRCSRSPA